MSEWEKGPKLSRTTNPCLATILVVVGLALIVAAALLYAKPWQGNSGDSDWSLTLVGPDGDQRVLSLKDVKAMLASEGTGGFFTTTGQIRGPFQVKGVAVEDLCDLVGGIGESDSVFVSAADGYSSVFDHDQASGDLPAYDPATMREVPHGELRLILMYKQDGKPLPDDDGKPLRLAIIGGEGLLTEGFYWIRWVDRIDVIHGG
jgi:DMSO/TMAO reductase YedYZ molybdopterin-dependent catalytic subunit